MSTLTVKNSLRSTLLEVLTGLPVVADHQQQHEDEIESIVSSVVKADAVVPEGSTQSPLQIRVKAYVMSIVAHKQRTVETADKMANPSAVRDELTTKALATLDSLLAE